MRTVTAIVGLSLAGLSLGACSGRHDASGNATASATSATAAASPAVAAATPKPGLWKMTISADGIPKPMVTQACVGAPAPGVNPFVPPSQPGQDCTKSSYTKTATGYAVDMECKMNGMTMSSKGDVAGDFSSHYTVAMQTKMGGPGLPAAMQTERASKLDAAYLGACPAGMAPGTAKQAG